jgi:hypothetical protein
MLGVTGTWAVTAYAADNLTEYAGEVIRAQITPVIVGVFSAVVACVLYDWWKFNGSPTWSVQGVAMAILMRRRRKKYIRAFSAWLITEAFEEAVFKERLTREEVDDLYQKIGSRCDMPDLLPTKSRIRFPDPDKLKEAIRNRINRKKPPTLKSVLFNKSK